jgi:hypothetical protein
VSWYFFFACFTSSSLGGIILQTCRPKTATLSPQVSKPGSLSMGALVIFPFKQQTKYISDFLDKNIPYFITNNVKISLVMNPQTIDKTVTG